MNGQSGQRRVGHRAGELAMLAIASVWLGVWLSSAGCASTPKASPTPPPAETVSPDPLPPVPIPEPPPPVAPRPKTVVIEPGGAARQPTLLEASAAAKKKRESAPESKYVITNDNLSDYAARGNVIIAHGDPEGPGEEDTSTTEVVRPSDERDEEYWRGRVLGIRQDWRRTLDEISELEEEAAQLRRDFYAADDPWHRDSQIKPAWDRTLDRLERAREDAEGFREELDTALTQGRREGALPGWLREGIELEPEPEDEDSRGSIREADVIEPPIFDEGGGPPR